MKFREGRCRANLPRLEIGTEQAAKAGVGAGCGLWDLRRLSEGGLWA